MTALVAISMFLAALSFASNAAPVLDNASSHTTRMEAGPTGFIQVTAPPGLKVFLDDNFAGVTSNDERGLVLLDVPVGERTIRLTGNGISPLEIKVTVVEDSVATVTANVRDLDVKVSERESGREVSTNQLTGTIVVSGLPMPFQFVLVNKLTGQEVANHYCRTGKTTLTQVPAVPLSARVVGNDSQLNFTFDLEPNDTCNIFVNISSGDTTVSSQQQKQIDTLSHNFQNGTATASEALDGLTRVLENNPYSNSAVIAIGSVLRPNSRSTADNKRQLFDQALADEYFNICERIARSMRSDGTSSDRQLSKMLDTIRESRQIFASNFLDSNRTQISRWRQLNDELDALSDWSTVQAQAQRYDHVRYMIELRSAGELDRRRIERAERNRDFDYESVLDNTETPQWSEASYAQAMNPLARSARAVDARYSSNNPPSKSNPLKSNFWIRYADWSDTVEVEGLPHALPTVKTLRVHAAKVGVFGPRETKIQLLHVEPYKSRYDKPGEPVRWLPGDPQDLVDLRFSERSVLNRRYNDLYYVLYFTNNTYKQRLDSLSRSRDAAWIPVSEAINGVPDRAMREELMRLIDE